MLKAASPTVVNLPLGPAKRGEPEDFMVLLVHKPKAPLRHHVVEGHAVFKKRTQQARAPLKKRLVLKGLARLNKGEIKLNKNVCFAFGFSTVGYVCSRVLN